MKIISWNVNLYLIRKESAKREYRILYYLLATKADIFFLQECSHSLISDLEKNAYITQGKTLSHGGWCCALTKIPVDSVSINNSVGISITMDGKMLSTCHLAPGAQNRNFRLSQLNDFREPDLICGDFNDENINICPLKRITNHKTWFLKFFQDGSSVSKKYDHVYHSVSVLVKNLIIGEYNGLSDHIPIQFEI